MEEAAIGIVFLILGAGIGIFCLLFRFVCWLLNIDI